MENTISTNLGKVCFVFLIQTISGLHYCILCISQKKLSSNVVNYNSYELVVSLIRVFISCATASLDISISALVVTLRSFTTPLWSSDSPIIIAHGIPFSSQYCNCANNLGLFLYDCSVWIKQKTYVYTFMLFVDL